MALNVNKVTENLHQTTNNLSNGHINIGNSMTELSLMDINCSNNSSMDQMDKMDQMEQQIQQQTQTKTLNQQFRFHAALTRTISTPQPQLKQHHLNQIHSHQQQQLQQQVQPQQQDANVATLVNTLIENLGNINLHRKLERTQSEPLPQQQVNTSRYKTELCRPFEEAGECKYGEKCQFAHGYHELRNLQRHPKYKTEYCRTFHSVGFCPYGPRCHFVHNADEARALQQQQQQQLQQQQQQQQTKLQQQNHSNYYPLSAKSSLNGGVGGSGGAINHSLPLSPPLSMSTGSDRESPTGSLSLSPTSSMTNFPFGEQISPANSVFQTAFTYVNTPPESPNAPMSPVNTPPPTLILGQTPVYIKPVVSNNVGSTTSQQQQPPAKQLLQKSSSSPIAVIRGGNTSATNSNANNTSKPPVKMNSVSSLNGAVSAEEARLPVFNRISSNTTAEVFSHVAL